MYITVLDYTWARVHLFDLTQVYVDHDTFDIEKFLEAQGFDTNQCHYMSSSDFPLTTETIYELTLSLQ